MRTDYCCPCYESRVWAPTSQAAYSQRADAATLHQLWQNVSNYKCDGLDGWTLPRLFQSVAVRMAYGL
jgi:hypothetical protein